MLSISRNQLRKTGFLPALLAIVLLWSSAFSFAVPQKANVATATKAAATLTAAEKKAASQVKLETIREITTSLSSKEFEGRGTGQPGADKAAAYIADRFAKLGLKPGGDNNTFLQAIKFRSTQFMPESSFKLGSESLIHGQDYVILPGFSKDTVDLSASVVFAGYGVVSPELKRDDLAGLDLKDKIVIITGGRPDGVDEGAWARVTAPQMRALTILGRGPVALIIANATSQPFATVANYMSRRRVSLGSAPAGPPFPTPPILMVGDAAMEKMFAGSEMTYAQTMEKAKTGVNVSRDLGKTANISLRIKTEETTSSNVVGVFEGSDPKLKGEAVVYTAHYDAYGIDSSGRIFPGAADNALGTATITAIAEAFVKAFPKASARPRRSILFLAVTGEEYGLLGAEYWVRNPTWPLDKVAADINFDGIGTEVYGPVKRVVGFGAEHSDLGKVFEDVMAATGLIVTQDPMPEERAFVRSDHYSFVKQGIPALMLMGAPDIEPSQLVPRIRKWMETDYHSVNDTVKPDWNWSGPQTLGQIGMLIGLRVANADAMPVWNASSQFNKPRPQPKTP